MTFAAFRFIISVYVAMAFFAACAAVPMHYRHSTTYWESFKIGLMAGWAVLTVLGGTLAIIIIGGGL